MIIPAILIAIVAVAVFSVLAGGAFGSARQKTLRDSSNEYVKALSELRQNPESAALKSEARYLGRNHVEFAMRSRGIEPSESDFETIDRDINHAVTGTYPAKSTDQTDRPNITPLGCFLAAVAVYAISKISPLIEGWLSGLFTLK